MRSLSWRSILYVITFVLFALAIVLWILTFVGWLITEPGFEPLNALVGALVSSLGGLLALLKARTAPPIPITTYSATHEQRQRNRRAMLELVKSFWVKGVLEQSLHGAAMIELGLERRADAVERPWDMVLQTPDQPNRPLPHGTKIVEVFDEMNRALLILGAPGSGKTTMLLELARDTIARAEKDPTQPIPVVFNLSSWTDTRQPIAEWLLDELNTKYNVPKKIAQSWVENDNLLLLLDGLDEVALERREDCVRAINDFRREHLVSLAVCSRVADYEVLTTRLKLQGAVLLQPLTPQQIDEYLEGIGIELLEVRRTLQHDTTLQELARSPLMLSIMILAYRGMSVKDLEVFDSIEARRRHVLDTYVQRMFKRRSAEQPHSPEQTIHWLAWLAQKMSQHAQTVFLIEGLQPSWLQTDVQRRLYSIISSLIWGLTAGLFTRVLSGPIAGIIIGLGTVLILEICYGSPNVEPIEALKWSWRNAGKEMLFWFFRGLIIGLISGLIGGLINELGGRLASGVLFALLQGLISGLIAWPILGPNTALSIGLIFGLLSALDVGLGNRLAFSGLSVELIDGLISGLVFGLLFGLLSGPRPTEIITRVIPNQGIRQSEKNAIIMWLSSVLAVWLFLGLFFWLARRLIQGLAFGLLFGLTSGLLYGGDAAVQHFTLRFILYRNGYIPWNYPHFLDYAAERIFLRKVGGGYVFVHRLLMDYFAALGQSQ